MSVTTNVRERLSELEHDQWAHWTRYFLDTLQVGVRDPRFREETQKRIALWRLQMETPYAELSDAEKDSDRRWADKVIAIMDNNI